MEQENTKKCSAGPRKELALVQIKSSVSSDKVALIVKEIRTIKEKPHTFHRDKQKGTPRGKLQLRLPKT